MRIRSLTILNWNTTILTKDVQNYKTIPIYYQIYKWQIRMSCYWWVTISPALINTRASSRLMQSWITATSIKRQTWVSFTQLPRPMLQHSKMRKWPGQWLGITTSCHMQRSIIIFGLATSHLDLVSKSKWKTTQVYTIPRWSFMLASSSIKNRQINRLKKSNKTRTIWKTYLPSWLTTMPSLVLNSSM